MSDINSSFAADLRATAEKLKQNATTTNLDAVVKREVTQEIYKGLGVTADAVKAVREADSLLANAANLAALELANAQFTATPPAPEDRFNLTVQGFGRDRYEATVRAQAEVGVETKELRGLQLGTARHVYHNTRGGAEHQAVKAYGTELGKPLLALIAKNRQD